MGVVIISKRTVSMKVTIFCLVLFLGIVSSQSTDEIPPELKCFLKGFFKCRKNLRSVCSEFEGNNRRPVPIPKNRTISGDCPILGQTIPKVDLASITLPDCPCVDGNSGDSVDVCFTCIDRGTGVVLKAPQEGKITIACKENNEGVDISSSKCE